jgi:prevent-host-death family protein
MILRRPAADEAIRTGREPDPAPGLEGQPRVDAGALEAALPSLLDHALRGPIVLTRHGREAFVLLPLDLWRRVWLSGDRPPLVEAAAEAPKPGDPEP